MNAKRACDFEHESVLALPKNERENEFMVRLMGGLKGPKGAWINAIREKDKVFSNSGKQIRLKFSRLSKSTNFIL